jgi:hypothetical protein
MSSTTFAIRGPGGEPIRFAYWVPNVSGGLVISNIEQRTSWEIDYNRIAEEVRQRLDESLDQFVANLEIRATVQ